MLDQEQMRWSQDHSDLDERVAKLAICAIPRGEGLVASGYGMLQCPREVEAIVRR